MLFNERNKKRNRLRYIQEHRNLAIKHIQANRAVTRETISKRTIELAIILIVVFVYYCLSELGLHWLWCTRRRVLLGEKESATRIRAKIWSTKRAKRKLFKLYSELISVSIWIAIYLYSPILFLYLYLSELFLALITLIILQIDRNHIWGHI